MARDKAKKKRRGVFLFGALIGAVVGLLCAPKTGREMRDQLFGGGLGEQKARLQDAVGAGKESAAHRSEDLKAKIEETRTRLREQIKL